MPYDINTNYSIMDHALVDVNIAVIQTRHHPFLYQLPSWPTPSGINETTATTFCENYIAASLSAQACLGAVTGINLDVALRGCVEDIQV